MHVIDFSFVYADDRYLDALGSGALPESADGLAVKLLAWRDAVDAEPIPELMLGWLNGWAA